MGPVWANMYPWLATECGMPSLQDWCSMQHLSTCGHELLWRWPCQSTCMSYSIGVRANIHLGGADRVLPEWIQWGGGVVAEIFRDPYSVGGGSSRNFPGSILCGWQNLFS